MKSCLAFVKQLESSRKQSMQHSILKIDYIQEKILQKLSLNIIKT